MPSKRNPAGVAQAALAIAVVGKFLLSMVESGEEKSMVLDAVERVFQMALDKQLAKVALDYDLDPLACVPWSKIHVPDFQAKRWPQVLAATAEFKRKYTERKARRAAPQKGTDP